MSGTEKFRETPRWMRFALIVSLAFNLLIVGIVVGFFVTDGPDRRSNHRTSDMGSVYTRALDDADRRALRQEFMSGLSGQDRGRTAFIADMQATLETLRASPFDQSRFIEAMAEQSGRRAERDKVGRTVLAHRIAAMSEDERAAYADRVAKALEALTKRVRR
ncbi:periplasmic heavy metal sensor [Marivita sp. S2033]|uniref:periplasmic heavy metal sensor n=1 Tax=Marivita sp. S2033 TaxID=3373187 RepID=UPI0039826D52